MNIIKKEQIKKIKKENKFTTHILIKIYKYNILIFI